MKEARIRQLQKVVRALQADGYEVKPYIKGQKRLLINIDLNSGDAEKIRAHWNDLRQVDGN